MKMIARSIACCVAMFALVVVGAGQARRPDPIGDETGRDAVGFRKDSATRESLGERRASANSPTTKQAIEDFMQLQKINRQIQDMSHADPPPLEGIAAAAKDVTARAKRLKVSLSLPVPPKDVIKAGMTPPASTDELLSQIKELDINVRAFVTNPIFRQMSDSVRDLPLEASVSLSKVIALSKGLEESAGRLRR